MDPIATAPTIDAQAKHDALYECLVSEPLLQAWLAEYDLPDDYDAALVAFADARGMSVTTADLRTIVREQRHHGSGQRMTRIWPGAGWMPARSVPAGQAPTFDWHHFGGQALRDSFFEETARRVGGRPFNQMFRTRTALDALVDGARDAATLAPTGFVFHMSRCGSTLVSNMLAAVPHHHVLSEAEPLDAVVQWAALSQAPLPERVAALRAIVAAFGRHRLGESRRFFIKLDSWHSVALPLFRSAFPEVPWLFVYRDPCEVMVSHQRQPGIHTVAGGLPQTVLGIARSEHLPREEYCALALARVCRAILDHMHLGGGMLVNYSMLETAMADAIPRHFGFVPDAGEAAMMRAAMRHHSKRRDTPFVSDTRAKRAVTTPEIAAAAATHLSEIYGSLEKRRANENA